MTDCPCHRFRTTIQWRRRFEQDFAPRQHGTAWDNAFYARARPRQYSEDLLSLSEISKQPINRELPRITDLRFDAVFRALLSFAIASVRSRAALQLEILALRHQICVLQRSVKCPKLSAADRLLWTWLRDLWDGWQTGLAIVKPATVVGWHRLGFRLFWRSKMLSGKTGRHAVAPEVGELIRTMSRENPLWGSPLIHGELLKLGIDIGQTTVAKYIFKRRKPPSQTWNNFWTTSQDTGLGGFLPPCRRFGPRSCTSFWYSRMSAGGSRTS